MSKYMQVPWRTTGRFVFDAHGTPVADCGNGSEDIARLIAAAPEMYEALKHCIDWFDAFGFAVPAAQQAKAAAAKAEGK